MLNIITLDSCASTSAELSAMPDAPEGTVVVTDCQTAGRGQRGNSWEAEPGKNLTFSLLLRPQGLGAARQYEVSMLVALATVRIINAHLAECGSQARATLKWPNDIYIDDNKISGTLIENKLMGSEIERSIVGIGIDVNQRIFTSDAPNPASLIHYTGTETELRPLLVRVCNAIVDDCRTYIAKPDPQRLHNQYMAALYRNDGDEHLFCEPEGQPFMARIVDVEVNGLLHLSNGTAYAFNEVAHGL